MPSIKFSGPLRFRLKGFLALNKIAIATYLNHAASRKIHPDWDANMEIGVRFIRHQFKRAFIPLLPQNPNFFMGYDAEIV
ncbi:hypothetical protein LY10_03902 [Planktotalea frisia]|uniref:Uncharacterized protein n=1 Tax=Planktotalea frisia TaxID=696762 RepID=A0A1L9P2A5_9RHOB|nr:hypothetical protein [Planktotalea frisia]OJI95544.1 hypothetical protein PFRI_02180 [Planktotalea frisia]PZX20463.1 hypothetical protein LY10_03902 [Planktotalea frisia]